jgi:hypothetical protein
LPNKTLRLQNGLVRGCRKTWLSIVVEEGAKLELDGSYVRDGEFAVDVKPGGKLEIIGSVFEYNPVAIRADRPHEMLVQGTNIIGNGSICSYLSQEPCSINQTISSNFLNKGAVLEGLPTNPVLFNHSSFENLGVGIISAASNMSIDQTTFSNILVNPSSMNETGRAIVQFGGSLSLNGFSFNDNEMPTNNAPYATFDNVHIGIEVTGKKGNLTLTQSLFKNTDHGVYIHENGHNAAIDIRNCGFAVRESALRINNCNIRTRVAGNEFAFTQDAQSGLIDISSSVFNNDFMNGFGLENGFFSIIFGREKMFQLLQPRTTLSCDFSTTVFLPPKMLLTTSPYRRRVMLNQCFRATTSKTQPTLN